jgi:hypothetical protein
MLHLSILRWGQPYESLEKDEVVHFSTGDDRDRQPGERRADPARRAEGGARA